MITKIVLKNYRCYEDHTVFFKPTTIVIGKNNAGKSTLIEGLRIVSLASSRFKTTNFKSAPAWTNLPKTRKGITPSLSKIEFSDKNIINQYGESPATILAEFENKETIQIYLNENGSVFATAKKNNGRYIKSKLESKELQTAKIGILPQISPLVETEKALDENYVKSNVITSLSSRHFRNQLSYLYEHYQNFKNVAESSWQGLRVVQLIKAQKGFTTIDPILLVQEEAFATEIGSMGHGLQMWLQTMWFIARTPIDHSIVLDEPDVYMHADLQRKLIRMLKGKYKQIIIATHSLEIMSEVDADNILIVDRRKDHSNFATELPEIQKVISNDLGSIHNLELAKLWSAKKFLMVEGNDIAILKRFQNTLFPQSESPIDTIPSSDIGGWGGWRYAIGTKFVLKNSGDEIIKIYCILDSDYHLPPDKQNRLSEAKKNDIELHIWNQKELENYLVVPEAILRAVIIKKPEIRDKLILETLVRQIDLICEDMKEEVIQDFAGEIDKYYRKDHTIIDFTNENKELKFELKNSMKVAKKYVESRWGNKIEIVPGKKLLKEINKWLNVNYKVNFSTLQLASTITKAEMPHELIGVFNSIENLDTMNNEA